jgi:hypothetical protein
MKHLKHILDFLNEDVHYESFPKPKWFFLVSRDNLLDKVATMNLEGVSGISSSPEIIYKWFDVRSVMLIMPGDKLLEMNNLHPVYYYNPDQLVSNNLALLTRLKQDYNATDPVKSTVQGVLQNATYQLDMQKKRYYKKAKFKERKPDRYELMQYVKRKHWAIATGVSKRVKDGFKIKNMRDFTNIVYSVILKDIEPDTKMNVPYGTTPYDKSKLNKDLLLTVLKGCVYYTGNVFNDEAEWIVKDKTLRVPKGSKLVIKQDVGNYSGRYEVRGLEPEKIEEIFEVLPELKEKYEVILVDNKDDAFEKFKDINKIEPNS